MKRYFVNEGYYASNILYYEVHEDYHIEFLKDKKTKKGTLGADYFDGLLLRRTMGSGRLREVTEQELVLWLSIYGS